MYSDLRENGYEDVEFFDGDLLRKNLERSFGHTLEDRFAMLEIIVDSALQSNKNGNIAILSSVGHKKKMRDYARARFERFMEVYLDCSSDVCARRDHKGLYERAKLGEIDVFAGITEPYEKSINPELVLNTADMHLEGCAKILLQKTVNYFSSNT